MDRLTSMEVFKSVVDLGSFSRAADRLELSKATVTAHVAALENRLGVRLLQRTTRRLSLTEDGAAYLEHVRRVLADVQETEAILSRARLVPQGLLRVDMPVALGRDYIVPALPRFAAQYPELRVLATLEDRYVDLVEAGVDVAVRVGPLQDASFIARRIYDTGFVTCASPDYLALHGTPATPTDLAAHNCLGFFALARGGIYEWTFEKDGERSTYTPGGTLSVSNAEALLDAAIAGAGIVQLIDVVVNRALAAGTLVPILADWGTPDRLPISVIYPQNRHLSAKVRAFVEFVAGLFPRRRGS
jgi:LysR family transcriptional regulator for bpeEF and oprC